MLPAMRRLGFLLFHTWPGGACCGYYDVPRCGEFDDVHRHVRTLNLSCQPHHNILIGCVNTANLTTVSVDVALATIRYHLATCANSHSSCVFELCREVLTSNACLFLNNPFPRLVTAGVGDRHGKNTANTG